MAQINYTVVCLDCGIASDTEYPMAFSKRHLRDGCERVYVTDDALNKYFDERERRYVRS